MGVTSLKRLSDYLSIEDKQLFFLTRKKEWVKKYECMNPSCNNKISGRRNHLLQENGILNFVSQDNKLYSYEGDIFGKPLAFKKTTKNKCMRANILCCTCDDKVFRNIEKTTPDYKKLNTFYLFSLRALIWERRKQEFNISFNKKCLTLFKHELFIKEVRQKIEYDEFCIKAEKAYERQYFKSPHPKLINYGTKHKVRIIPKIEVGLSSHVSLVRNSKDIFYYHGYFIHIIPMNTKSVLIIGTDIDKHNWINSKNTMDGKHGTFMDRFYYKFQSYDQKTLQKYISFFMLMTSEDWVCSEGFYLKYIKPKEEEVLSAIRSSFNMPSKLSIKNGLIEDGYFMNIFQT